MFNKKPTALSGLNVDVDDGDVRTIWQLGVDQIDDPLSFRLLPACVFIISNHPISVSLTCGSSTSENCTYLVQSGVTSVSPNPCTYTICKCSNTICRIRFDFTIFDLAPPVLGEVSDAPVQSQGGAIGDCTSDTFSVTSPGGSGSPIICGINTGQHLIVDASDECNVAAFSLGGIGSTSRSWDIKGHLDAYNIILDLVEQSQGLPDTPFFFKMDDYKDLITGLVTAMKDNTEQTHATITEFREAQT
ncbi:hypothetical protein TCAL_16686 [Tigriopus californicus]|uniref:Uncharacterized protein n=1 Tax=Tigriopus californicus TaxID=6832 RepID=A0A553PKG4_TIGCA|nr:hypothetical protein TCAL_16686 [Tigriopus californicus]